MNGPRRAGPVALAVMAVLAWPAVSFGQVRVIISGGFSAAYRELLPEFEKASGVTITTTSEDPSEPGRTQSLGSFVEAYPADVVILAREGLGELLAEGKVIAGTDVDLARSIIGMIVRAGAPKPDIS